MKALIWKEWRELGKWIIVPSFLILVPMGLMSVPSLLDTQYLAYVSLVDALFGAMLGFLQVFTEARGDKRSMLLHRPLSRSRIFLAKVLSGVGLYTLGVGLPFACAIALAATPGHVDEPFVSSMVLPWLADCLTGLVCYFAGMLTAQREARWYGSRCLGLAAGYASWLAVWMLPDFRDALVAIFLIGVPVALAAWGSFITGGVYSNQPRLAKLALAVSFLLGLSALSVTAKLWLGAWFFHKSEHWYELDRHGQVLAVHYEDGMLRSVTDLAGRVSPELQGKRLDHYELDKVAVPRARGGVPRTRSYRNMNQFFLDCDNASRPGSEKWWYVPAQGRLLGYDKHSHQRLGSIGPDGFVPPGQPRKDRFHGELAHFSRIFYSKAGPYLAFPDAVYAVNFRAPKTSRLFTPAPGETVLWASHWENEKQKQALAFVGTNQAVHVLAESGTPITSLARSRHLENFQVTGVGRLNDPERYWVWYEPKWYLKLDRLDTMPAVVTVFDRAGREILPRQEVPPRPGGVHNMIPNIPVVEPSTAQLAFGPTTAPVEAVCLLGSMRALEAGVRANDGKETPIVLPILYTITDGYLPGVRWDWQARPGLAVTYAMLVLAAALLCAVVCFVLGRRHGFSLGQSAGWGCTGLAFGWMGLVLMLAVQERPGRVICPKCRKPRVVTREACEHCGAEHAVPASDGTEVFEDGLADAESVLAAR